MHPRAAATLLLAVAVVAAACGGGDDGDSTATTRRRATTTIAPPTTTAAAAPVAPLTGLAQGADNRGRVALVVKVDNAPKARPQGGINQADVIVEEGVEGGITRFAAIFHSTDAALVGPVRSARTTDIAILAPLNHPLYAWSGANADFKSLIRAAPLHDVGAEAAGAVYHREPGRTNPYNLFSTTPKLFALAPNAATPPPPLFPFRAPGQAVTNAGAASARHVEIYWKIIVETRVDWVWDAGASGWRRTQNATPHVDSTGQQVVAPNVIIQLVSYHDTGYFDQSNNAVPEADLVGKGDVWVLTDGKIVKGTWSKSDRDAITTYVDSAGKPIPLTPGRTWVELVPPGQARVVA